MFLLFFWDWYEFILCQELTQNQFCCHYFDALLFFNGAGSLGVSEEKGEYRYE